jgi:hypothetical protein
LLAGGLVWLLSAAGALALPLVTYTTTDLGGGWFEYQLSVDNTGGSEALAGLNILHGASVFGLDGSSTIGAPAGWGYFEPLPPLIDDLNYFSTSLATDVAVDDTLGGFSFVSDTDPESLAPGDFAVEAIGADCACQIPLGDAQPVPEPTLGILLGAGLAVARRRRRIAQ